MEHQHRRHSRWYERVLFNFWFQLICGMMLVGILPSILIWPKVLHFDAYYITPTRFYTTSANIFAFFLSFLMYKKIQKFPDARSIIYLLPSVTIAWLVIIGIIIVFKLEYSRTVLFLAYMFANVWTVIGYVLGRKYYCLKLAIVPFGDIGEIQRFRNVDSRTLETPHLGSTRFDAVVADLRADMPDEWARFLGNCAIAGIPVYHSRQMLEQFTGRVKIKHLSENVFGTLQPSAFYGIIKRCIDIIAVILLLPIVLLILIIVGILIKLDSKGPVFYIQKRIGYKNKVFKMYKLRSMRIDLAGKGFTEQGEDPRITRIGKVIRKYRIDELPQLLNVLKGDMSFIGPRPESLDLSVWYEKEVPFFSYRHIVRPGISGWAQVTQGYAAEVEGMTTKLQYDFYYIKHFSFWLDVLIVFKTIKTMLTGFGAR